MRHTLPILTLTVLFSATVLAQEGGAPSTSAPASIAVTPAASSQQPPAPLGLRATRRPSMVGYIDNGLVQSQVRFRFDSGFGNDRPDRAEFFYAKCGCYQGLPTTAGAFDPDAPGPGGGIATALNFRQLYLDAEYAPHSRFSVFAEIPMRWIQPQAFSLGSFSNQAGLGDIRAGAKLALVSSPNSSLTIQLRGYFPSGSGSDGLGTKHGSFEPALLYHQQFSDRLALESQIGDWHPTGGSAGVPTASSDQFSGDVLFYGVGPSYEVYRSDTIRFAPVVELVGWNVRGGFQTRLGGPVEGVADIANGTNIVNLKLGGRIILHDRSSFYVGYGRALTDDVWYEDIVRLEYRYSF